jgi:hypothetical protein
MTSPVERISGPSTVSTPAKRANGKTASLTAMWSYGTCRQAEAGQRLAGHDLGGDGGDRLADGLGDERHGARGARVHFQHVDARGVRVRLLDGELHVHQAADVQGQSHLHGLALQLLDRLGRQREGRHRAGRVARVDAGFLDMLQHAGHEHVLAVAQGVDVDFRGAAQIVVQQDRVLERDLTGVGDVAFQVLVITDDLHATTAQHVGRTHHEREADLFAGGAGLVPGAGDGVFRLGDVEAVQQLLEALAVLGQVDGVRAGAQDRDAGLFQRMGQLQRGLAAELDDDAGQRAVAHLDMQQLQHVLGRQRLEVQAVGGVVVGRDGLGVAVDHDRLDADLVQREGRVAAAVVELDALADPVGTAAQDHRLLAVEGRLSHSGIWPRAPVS